MHWNLQENEAPVRTSNDGETSSDSEDDLDDDDFDPDKETTVYMAGNKRETCIYLFLYLFVPKESKYKIITNSFFNRAQS